MKQFLKSLNLHNVKASKSRLKDNELSFYYTLNGKSTTYSMTMNNAFTTDKKYADFVLFGDCVAIHFNNRDGFKINFAGKDKQNIRVDGKSMIEFVFEKIDKEKDRKVVTFRQVDNDLIVLEL